MIRLLTYRAPFGVFRIIPKRCDYPSVHHTHTSTKHEEREDTSSPPFTNTPFGYLSKRVSVRSLPFSIYSRNDGVLFITRYLRVFLFRFPIRRGRSFTVPCEGDEDPRRFLYSTKKDEGTFRIRATPLPIRLKRISNAVAMEKQIRRFRRSGADVFIQTA